MTLITCIGNKGRHLEAISMNKMDYIGYTLAHSFMPFFLSIVSLLLFLLPQWSYFCFQAEFQFI